MRPLFWLLLAATLVFSATVQADNGVGALKHFYNEVDSLSMHFKQVQRDEDGNVLRRSSGIFLLQRPGKFRWAYQKPYKQIIVSDGTLFKFYDVDLAQVTIRKVSNTLQATPAQLLTGGTGLTDAFKVKDDGTHDGLHWLVLVPRSDDSDFKQVRLGLKDDMPEAMELDDRLGQATTIHFSDIDVNPAIPDDRFDIDIPDDVTVVDSRKQQSGQ